MDRIEVFIAFSVKSLSIVPVQLPCRGQPSYTIKYCDLKILVCEIFIACINEWNKNLIIALVFKRLKSLVGCFCKV